MHRRQFIGLASMAGISALAGCSNLFGPDPEPITGASDDGSGGGSGAVSITRVEGIDTDGNNTIDTLRAHVVLSRGSSAVDLSKASYTLQRNKRTIDGDTESQNAYLENGGNGVSFEKVEGGDGDSSVLQQREDKVVVQFDLIAIDRRPGKDIDPLEPEAEMTFELQTPQGSTSSEQLTAPETISPDETYPIQ